MVEIIPSILTHDPLEFQKMMTRIEDLVERVHIDIMDGEFVGNETIEPSLLVDFETALLVDFHLSTKEPIEWVAECARVRADRIIGHIEEMDSQREYVDKVLASKIGVGIAIDIDTPLLELEENILPDLDTILLMAYSTGFGGQPFDNRVLEKIEELSGIRKNKGFHFSLGVDGGMDEETIIKVIKKGADEVVVGKRLFKGRLEDNLSKLKNAAKRT